MTVNAPTFLTRSELAAKLQITPRSLSKLLRVRKVPVVRIGRRIRIPVESVATLVGE